MTQSTKTSSPRGFWKAQASFVTAVVILAAAATILNVLNLNLGLHFKKEAVPQPKDFHDLPALMGKWLQISQDTKLDPQTQEVLGTENYCYRDYIRVDTRGKDLLDYFAKQQTIGAIAAASQPTTNLDWNSTPIDQQVAMVRATVKGKTAGDIAKAIQSLQLAKNAGVIDMGLTYYTGLVDTVAHIPDRCYIADGYEPSSYTEPFLDMGSGQKMQVRFIAFDDSSGSNRVPKCVSYVFHSNGQYNEDPINVRRTLANLTERYGYYAKIELMTIVPSSRDRDTQPAQDTMADFLRTAKPYIETCFPDWQKLKHSR